MGIYLVKRIFSVILILWLASTFIFALIHLVPGDPVLVILGSEAEEGQVRAMRHALGLDRPLLAQYGSWLSKLAKGDLGTSILTEQPVSEMILERMPTTMTIAVAALILSLSFSIPAGVFAALRHNTYTDFIFMGLAIVAVSVPSFWLGLLFILLFSVKLKLFPMVGYVSIFEDFWLGIQYVILPAISLAAFST